MSCTEKKYGNIRDRGNKSCQNFRKYEGQDISQFPSVPYKTNRVYPERMQPDLKVVRCCYELHGLTSSIVSSCIIAKVERTTEHMDLRRTDRERCFIEASITTVTGGAMRD